MDQGTVNPKMKLEDQGITGLGYVYYNRSEAELQDAKYEIGIKGNIEKSIAQNIGNSNTLTHNTNSRTSSASHS